VSGVETLAPPFVFRLTWLGFVGQQLTSLLLELFPSLRIITTDIVEPPRSIDDEKRLKVVKADLGDLSQVKKLFEGETIGGVYALQ
jgi:nucleoside-diphosphate-sugar epimerase